MAGRVPAIRPLPSVRRQPWNTLGHDGEDTIPFIVKALYFRAQRRFADNA
jgi:hypothetical protein